MIRRINLYGGPGSGKSTMAAFIYSAMKRNGCNIELVDEYVKLWAYEGRKVNQFDQLYLFAKQLRKEYTILRNDVDFIVTDSPVYLSACYGKLFGFVGWESLKEIADKFEYEYPSIHIVLDRSDCPYQSVGRYQDEDEASKIDDFIVEYLSDCRCDFNIFNYDDNDAIYAFLEGMIVPDVCPVKGKGGNRKDKISWPERKKESW